MLDATMSGGAIRMIDLARNDLVWIDALAWQQIKARDWDGQAQEILAHWQRCSLPLVVCRQRSDAPAHALCLGLPAPSAWGRRRLAVPVLQENVTKRGAFPALLQVAQANHWGPAAFALSSALLHCGADARVYGSHGWQILTDLNYVHAQSDLDLTIQVRDVETARQVVQHLAATNLPQRLDGEIMFAGGQAVAWRELHQLMVGQVAQVMVKARCGVCLAPLSALHQFAHSQQEAGTETRLAVS